MFCCLFGVYFSLIWRRYHYQRRAANFFYLCSALMAIEQWGLFSLPHLLRERDTNTYCLAFISGAVTTCFYSLDLSQLGFEHPILRLWKGWIYDLTLRFMTLQIKLVFNTPFSISIEKEKHKKFCCGVIKLNNTVD